MVTEGRFSSFRVPAGTGSSCRKLVVAAALSLASLSAAHAVTFTVTEGTGSNRPQVAGSIDVGDASSGGAGINLNSLSGGTFGAGDTIGIYGRIVGATDRFTYTFTATQGFNVSFDFDGYALEGGGSVASGRSGLINQSDVGVDSDSNLSAGGKSVLISLYDVLNATMVSRLFTTNVISSTASSAAIFWGIDPGKYRLIVDGSLGNMQSTPALYDILVTTVPIPAALPLLASAFGFLGLLGWRRRRGEAAVA